MAQPVLGFTVASMRSISPLRWSRLERMAGVRFSDEQRADLVRAWRLHLVTASAKADTSLRWPNVEDRIAELRGAAAVIMKHMNARDNLGGGVLSHLEDVAAAAEIDLPDFGDLYRDAGLLVATIDAGARIRAVGSSVGEGDEGRGEFIRAAYVVFAQAGGQGKGYRNKNQPRGHRFARLVYWLIRMHPLKAPSRSAVLRSVEDAAKHHR